MLGNWLKLWVPIIIVSLIISITLASSVDAQGKYSIPAWVKGVAGFWAEDKISDQEFGEGLTFLIDQGLIKVPKITELENRVHQLENENAKLQALLNSEIIETDRNSYLDDSKYLDNGCPVGYPYIWSDGLCHVLAELNCPADHPYIWSDGFCYTMPEYTYDEPVDSAPSCDPSYPDVCIPPYPPDLDCGEIGYSNFRVTGSDPHGFDGDNDGIGCES